MEVEQQVYNLAEDIMHGRIFRTVNNDIYVFSDRIYEPADHVIEFETIEALKNKFTTFKLRNVKKIIATLSRPKRYEEIEPDINLIPLKNKIFNIQTGEIMHYSPRHFFTYKHSFDFDPKATCPTIDAFLNDIVTPVDRTILEEFIGFCFLRDYRFHKALILLGNGANGKTTFLNLLYELFDKHNTVSISLQDLLKRKFLTIQLKDKIANIYDDIPYKPLQYADILKVLTGEGTITADRKNKDPTTFKNYAKLIFAGNKLPESEDATAAFYKRLILIVFPNKFEDDKADPKLLEKMIPELPGFFNVIMGRLRMLLKRGFFKIMNSEQRYLELSNSVSSFFNNRIESEPDSELTREEIYEAYADYCKEKHLVPETRRYFIRKFNQLLKDMNFNVESQRMTLEGKKVHIYLGIGIKRL